MTDSAEASNSGTQHIRLTKEETTLPPAILLGGSHRLTDSWVPSHSVLIAPGWRYPRHTVTFRLTDGPLALERPHTLRGTVRRLARRSRLDLPDSAIGFDCRHDSTANIAHALMGQIGVALLGIAAAGLSDRAKDLVFVVHTNTPSYITELFRLLGFSFIADSDADVLGWHLSMTPTKLPLRALAAKAIRSHAESIGLLSDSDAIRPPIFLARRHRTLSNLSQVQSLLEARGFQTMFAEDHRVEDQIKAVANADVVFGLHGAALGHLMFRSPSRRGTVIETFSCGYTTNLYRSICNFTNDAWLGGLGDFDVEPLRGMLGQEPPRAFHSIDYRLNPEVIRILLAMCSKLRSCGGSCPMDQLLCLVPSITTRFSVGGDGSVIRSAVQQSADHDTMLGHANASAVTE